MDPYHVRNLNCIDSSSLTNNNDIVGPLPSQLESGALPLEIASSVTGEGKVQASKRAFISPALRRNAQRIQLAARPLPTLNPKSIAPLQAGFSKMNRQDILRKVKKRRDEMKEEVSKTKVKLWETTIEQGVLMNILKDNDLGTGDLVGSGNGNKQ